MKVESPRPQIPRHFLLNQCSLLRQRLFCFVIMAKTQKGHRRAGQETDIIAVMKVILMPVRKTLREEIAECLFMGSREKARRQLPNAQNPYVRWGVARKAAGIPEPAGYAGSGAACCMQRTPFETCSMSQHVAERPEASTDPALPAGTRGACKAARGML